MIVGVVKENGPDERRVALVPSTLTSLAQAGCDVLIEPAAGLEAGFADADYLAKGARIATCRADVFARADVVLQVRSPGSDFDAGMTDLEWVRQGQVFLGFCDPLSPGGAAAAQRLAVRGATLFSLELIPRITRAQSMDALSSMASIAGYKAVLLAAATLPKIFPMMMTAAGTISPSKVFIVGAGVAGLQAIASARRLGAVVEAYDVRPVVKEQVESLGAKFLDLPLETSKAQDQGGYAKAQDDAFYRRQREMMLKAMSANDVVITTAAVPGRKAPTLVTTEMVRAMRPGSVIVDLAAERGGNCELTKPGETVVEGGVTILGPTNLAATVPLHASQMFARNISTFLAHLLGNGRFAFDLADEITRETLVARGGEIVHSRVREVLGLPALNAAPPAADNRVA